MADGDGSVQPVRVGLLFLPAAHRVQPVSQDEPVAAPLLITLNVSMMHLQSEQDTLPAEDIVLTGHEREQAAFCNPGTSPYVLAGHGIQAVPPVEYVPALQSIQSALVVLPAEDDLPAAQLIHAVPPVEYVPAAHEVHAVFAVLPAGDEKPAAQEAQTLELVKVFDVAPARAYLPTGQVKVPVHEAVVKRVVDPYVPAGQLIQVVELAVE